MTPSRVVRGTRPKAVICENVRGLLRPSFKPYFDYILRELSAPFERRIDGEAWTEHDQRLRKTLRKDPRGSSDLTERYVVTPVLVNAADYGVPQIRHRVIIVGFRADLGIDWKAPVPTHGEAELRASMRSGDYWDEHPEAPRTEAPSRASRAVQDALVYEGQVGKQRWLTLRDALKNPVPLPEPVEYTEYEGFHHHIGWPGARVYPGHTPNKLDWPAKTVKAGVHGVAGGELVMLKDDGEHRYMTVREVARVMTFPDWWRLSGPRGEQMRQLGNAVPVKLGRVFADSVAAALGIGERRPGQEVGNSSRELVEQ